jgi:hypothetical protein
LWQKYTPCGEQLLSETATQILELDWKSNPRKWAVRILLKKWQRKISRCHVFNDHLLVLSSVNALFSKIIILHWTGGDGQQRTELEG